MKRKAQLLLVSFLATLAVMPMASAETIYFQADFNDKPLDTPIGTGGPTLGEPVEVGSGITAIVRGAPMPTPCLEIQDNDDYMADGITIDFLENAELVTGEVGISAMLWFSALTPGYDFSISVREHDSAAHQFADIDFYSDGRVYAFDANGPYQLIGTYEVGRAIAVGIIFDMDAGTYDIWLDGQRVLEDETHGIAGRGVGGVIIGCLHDSDLEGHFFVDDILVANYLPTTESESAIWGQVKALYH